MDVFLTLLRHSLNQQPRQQHFHLKRAAVAAIVGLLVLSHFWDLGVNSDITGRALFTTLGSLGMMMAAFIVPMLTAGVIAKERDHNTLGLLLMTDLSAGRFVLGRAGTAIWTGMLVLASTLPLLLLCRSMGGISLQQVSATLAVLAVVIIVGACIGIFASSVAPTEKQAAFWGLLVTVMLYFVLPRLVLAFSTYMFGSSRFDDVLKTTILPAFSPKYALFAILNIEYSGTPWYLLYIPVMLLLAALLLLATRMRVVYLASGVADARTTTPVRHGGLLGRLEAWQKRPERAKRENENPLIWKERVRSMWGFTAISLGAVLLLALPAAWVLQNYSFLLPAAVLVVSGLIFSLGVLVRSSLAFTLELENRTLDLLILSGMSADDIIMGKFWGYVNAYLPWLCAAGLSLLMLGNDEHFNLVALASLLTLAATFLFATWSMLLSICGRKTLAMVAGLGGFGLSAVSIPALLPNTAIAVGALVLALGLGIFLMQRLYRRFGEYANLEAA